MVAGNAAAIRRALADPAVQAAVLGLLGQDDAERRREAARRGLEDLGLLDPAERPGEG